MTAVEVAAFIKRHWKPARSWPRSALVPWVQWYMDDDRLVTVKRGDKMIGLCMGRILPAPEAHVDHYIHDEYSTLLWIDLFISQDRHVARIICDAFLKRFGKLEAVGFCRDERPVSKPRFHDFNRIERTMRYGK